MSGPSMSMIDNTSGVGIGNYKGVMLCNRPFGGTGNKSSSKLIGSSDKAFTTGVVPDTIGVNVPIPLLKDKNISKKPKKESVLTKHKKWLAELQKTKEKFELQMIEEATKKEESQRKFQEHESRMRTMVKSLRSGEFETKNSPTSKDVPETNENYSYGKEDEKSDSKKYVVPKLQINKPAWALSEKDADQYIEEKENEDVDELIEFAKGLDFDKYIGDVEVQTMMERLKKRILELEREVSQEDQREADLDSRAAKKNLIDKLGNVETELGRRGEKDEGIQSMMEAKALLQEDEDMQAIHSMKSVAALVQQAKDKIQVIAASVKPHDQPPAIPHVYNEPRIVSHETSEGRIDGKNAISNLPYMHRNPAI